MIAKFHIPTEQYGFVEVEEEVDTTEQAISRYNELAGGEGLERKEFNEALDRYLNKGDGVTEIYLKMNRKQQDLFQELKKAFKRINKE